MKRLPLLVFLIIALGWRCSAETGTDSPTEIVLGMSTVLSGLTADLGKEMKQGVLAGLERANRDGGIHGRRLRLIALDDGYEPARTPPNMRRLLQTEHVLAVVGNVGTPTAIAAIPIANEQKTLFYAPFTGAGVLRKSPCDRYVINYRASYDQEISAMVDALVDGAGLKPTDIAFFTQQDGYGNAGLSCGIAALKRHGLKDEREVLQARYERNTLAVENGLASLLLDEHEPRVIIMVGAYAPCAKFIRLAHNAGLNALFVNVSFVGSNSLAAELGRLPVRVIVTQVVPYPRDTDLPLVREYQADMMAFEPNTAPGFGSLEGYLATRVLLRALEKMPGPPTREGVIDALEGLGTFDLGLGTPLSLGPENHQACNRVWPTILKDGEFVPFSWTEIGSLIQQGNGP